MARSVRHPAGTKEAFWASTHAAGCGGTLQGPTIIIMSQQNNNSIWLFAQQLCTESPFLGK